jgi:hypothetical protein
MFKHSEAHLTWTQMAPNHQMLIDRHSVLGIGMK